MGMNGELEGGGYSSSFFKVRFCSVDCSFCSDSVGSWGDKGMTAGETEVTGPGPEQIFSPETTRLPGTLPVPPSPAPAPSNSRGSDPAFGKE